MDNEQPTLTRDVTEQTVLSETVTIVKDQLFKKKEEIVKLRLKQLGKLNVLRYASNRFKKLMVERHPDREEVWIDDGSKYGKRVVTFYQVKDTSMEGSELKFKLLYKFD